MPIRASQARHARLFLPLGLLLACGEATGPSSHVLLGQWGDGIRELVATATGAELRLGCLTIVMDSPIGLRAGDAFSARGEVHQRMPTVGDLPTVRVSGRVSEAQLTLAVPGVLDAGAATLVLEAGVPHDPGHLTGCPV